MVSYYYFYLGKKFEVYCCGVFGVADRFLSHECNIDKIVIGMKSQLILCLFFFVFFIGTIALRALLLVGVDSTIIITNANMIGTHAL